MKIKNNECLSKIEIKKEMIKHILECNKREDMTSKNLVLQSGFLLIFLSILLFMLLVLSNILLNSDFNLPVTYITISLLYLILISSIMVVLMSFKNNKYIKPTYDFTKYMSSDLSENEFLNIKLTDIKEINKNLISINRKRKNLLSASTILILIFLSILIIYNFLLIFL